MYYPVNHFQGCSQPSNASISRPFPILTLSTTRSFFFSNGLFPLDTKLRGRPAQKLPPPLPAYWIYLVNVGWGGGSPYSSPSLLFPSSPTPVAFLRQIVIHPPPFPLLLATTLPYLTNLIKAQLESLFLLPFNRNPPPPRPLLRKCYPLQLGYRPWLLQPPPPHPSLSSVWVQPFNPNFPPSFSAVRFPNTFYTLHV